jgi:SAM-dependent methyltransferase
MTTDSLLLQAVYNAGERLVPGETHDRAEIIRHKSSYKFFRDVIELDILSDPGMLKNGIRILDIGCGTGHGTFMLSEILGAKIVGIDPSMESIQYAKKNYHADSIEYINDNAEAYVRTTPTFDYVVSRHALEHVEDGLNFALGVICRKRLMVNVPFNESEGNIHHKVHRIKEEHFDLYTNKEFFYEGLDGLTVSERTDDNPPNSIVCISRASDLISVRDIVKFPFPAWQPEFLQDMGIVAIEQATAISKKEAEKEAEFEAQKTALLARNAIIDEKEAELETQKTNLLARESDLNQREAILANSLCAKILRKLRKLKGLL